jgi:hypothetical protein
MTITPRRLRLTAALATTLGAVAIMPAGALASTTWFGSSLDHSPANAGSSCDQQNIDAPAPNCTHVGSFYPGFSGRAKSPTNGTIVAVKVNAAGPMSLRFQLVQVRNLNSNETQGQAKVIKNGPKINIAGATLDSNGDDVPQTFPVNIKVKKGQELAITTNNNQAEYCSDGTPGQLTYFSPTLGSTFRTNSGVDDCLLLVQAVVRH